jgi:ubiquitin carboxyl-terminal hydrolase 25/28
VEGWSHGEKLSGPKNVIRYSAFINNDDDADYMAVITLLASLFWDLEYCETAAVTPNLELAKLALVTSKDEEEDEDKGGTDSSNDTDATLVEDGPARIPAVDQPLPASQEVNMDVDTPHASDAPLRSTSPMASGEASSSKIPPTSRDTSLTKKATTLPPRKADVSDSTMMFGNWSLYR